MTFDPHVPGTVCCFNLEPYYLRAKFDAFVVSLGKGSKNHLVKCLIIGFDSDDFDVRTGEVVELPRSDLRSFELKPWVSHE